jgi:hypothetical protein
LDKSECRWSRAVSASSGLNRSALNVFAAPGPHEEGSIVLARRLHRVRSSQVEWQLA